MNQKTACLPASTPPHLIVVVDTEEEFDWSKPPERAATTVKALAHIGRAQDIFDDFGITPVYVVDYPVADQPEAAAQLRQYVDTGRAIIGAHLQTWTCPPFEEDVSPFNSFQCNLPAALEREKLLRLIARIEETFALRPTIHKAGRYGFSPRAVGMLQALGFRYDLSIGARYDASHEGGPDFRRHSAAPFWLDEEGGMLALPTTAGFSGMAAAAGPWLHPLISNPVMKRVRAEAAFSRLGVLERVRLSPEGHTLGELKRVTRALLRQGVRVLTFSFHSPSVMPGCTPYVSTDDDLVCFLRTCRDYLAFFRDEIGGTFSTPDGVRAALKD